jgi:hypothetical protein
MEGEGGNGMGRQFSRNNSVEPRMNLARRSRNQPHASIQILQKATKGTKGQGKSCDSLFPLLPFVKTSSFEPLENCGG